MTISEIRNTDRYVKAQNKIFDITKSCNSLERTIQLKEIMNKCDKANDLESYIAVADILKNSL